MTAQTSTTLKGYFNTGDQPTESNFADLIDSNVPLFADLVVAASNAPARIKAQADYVCDGTDDQEQIQAAIDALPAIGGRIFLSSGTFLLSWAGELIQDVLTSPYCVKVIQTHPPVSFQGVPGATVIKLADSQPINSTLILIRGTVASRRTNPVNFDGIVFDGNAANQVGEWTNFGCIAMGDADGLTVTSCRFKNWSRNGIHCAWTAQRAIISSNYFYGQGAIRLEMHNYTVVGNIFEDPNSIEAIPGGANVQIICDADRLFTSRMQSIVGNKFIGGMYPLYLSGSQACVVMGNTFCDQGNANTYALALTHYGGGAGSEYDVRNNVVVGNTFYNCANGIFVGGNGTDLNAHGNIIANNNFMVGPDRNMSYGINEGWSLDAKNLLVDNFFDSTGIAVKISSTGVGTVVRGNINYTTENRGTGTIASGQTSVVITHGLSITPTAARIGIIPTNNPTADPGNIWVDAIGTTYFTVNCRADPGESGLSFGWKYD